MLWAKSQAGPIHSLWALSGSFLTLFFIFLVHHYRGFNYLHEHCGSLHTSTLGHYSSQCIFESERKRGLCFWFSLKLLFFMRRLGQILAFWTLPWFPSSSMSYSQSVLMQMTENSEYESKAGWHCCAGSFSKGAKQVERGRTWKSVPSHQIWRIVEITLRKIYVEWRDNQICGGTASSGAHRIF